MKKRTCLILIFLLVCFVFYSLVNLYLKDLLKETYFVEEKKKEQLIIEVNELIVDKKSIEIGIKNTNILQKAIDEVSNGGGGTVIIPKGDFWFTVAEDNENHQYIVEDKIRGHFVIKCRNNVLIEGAGMDETNLRVFGSFPHGLDMFHYRNHEAFKICDPSNPSKDCYEKFLVNADFRNFTIDGLEAHSTSTDFNAMGKGFMLDPIKDCDWDSVKVVNTDGTGFGMDLPVNCTIKNCVAIGNGKAATESDVGASGFGVGTGLLDSESMYIENCIAIGNMKFGFFFEHQGRFHSDIKATKANGTNKDTNIKGFVVFNSISKNNMYNFGGEKANDVTYVNNFSNVTKEKYTDLNPLNKTNTSSIYLGLDSRRINFVNNKVEYNTVSKSVQWALDNNIVDGGVKQPIFNYNDVLDRKTAITLIWKLAGRPGNVLLNYSENNKYIDTGYKDIPKCWWGNCDWYIAAVDWGIKEGILSSELTKFNPNNNCGNVDFILMLWRYFGKPIVNVENGFKVGDLGGVIKESHVNAMNWALNLKIIDKNIDYSYGYSKKEAIDLIYNAYHKIQKKSFLVTYDYSTNGGISVSKKSDKFYSGDVVNLDVTATKGEGYVFVGWNTDKNAKNGLSVVLIEDSDINLYAIYKKK